MIFYYNLYCNNITFGSVHLFFICSVLRTNMEYALYATYSIINNINYNDGVRLICHIGIFNCYQPS